MVIMPLPTTMPGRRGGKQQPQKSSLAVTKTTQTMQQVMTSGTKSPIKKHLQNVASSPHWPTAKASSSRSSPFPQQQTAKFQTKSSSDGTTKMASLRELTLEPAINARAAIVQVMLSLLDQERPTVAGTIPILQTLVALPLDNASMRKQCIDMLTKLHEGSMALPKKYTQDARFDAASDVATSEGGGDDIPIMPPSFCYDRDDTDLQFTVAPALQKTKTTGSKDNGQPKKLSLHHCKEFLFACANEIHELEDENPNFDYAEETSSERPAENVFAPKQLVIKRPSRASTDFDYASTANSPSSFATDLAGSFDGDQDDLETDQDSEFSEILRRADYLSDFDDDEVEDTVRTNAMSTLANTRDRVLCRQVFQAWRRSSMRDSSSLRHARDLKLKYRVFTASKQHGDHSLRNTTRKKLAFETMKAHSQQMRLKRSMTKNLRIATRRIILLPSSSSIAIKQIPTIFNTAPSPAFKSTANNENQATETTMQATHSPSHLNLPLLRAKMLMSQHVDLVLCLIVALFMHTMLG
ncbi:hypothetical protein FI667_g11625, partial [Globisporangium splendens]